MANKAPFCEKWRCMSNREAVEGIPQGKVNVKTETR